MVQSQCCQKSVPGIMKTRFYTKKISILKLSNFDWSENLIQEKPSILYSTNQNNRYHSGPSLGPQ
jgi:hypothetical protein